MSTLTHEKDLFSPYQIKKLEAFKAFLDEHKDVAREKLKLIIDRFNINNLPNLEEPERSIDGMMFYSRDDSYFSFLAYANGEDIKHMYLGETLFPVYLEKHSFDFAYPANLDVHLEGYRNHVLLEKRKEMAFCCFLELWTQLGGHHICKGAYTWEDNFDLIDLNWIFTDSPPIEGFPYSRELTDFEMKGNIQMDVNYGMFKQNWRYFEKGDEFFEVGYYFNIIGTRRGKIIDFEKVPFNFEKKHYEPSNNKEAKDWVRAPRFVDIRTMVKQFFKTAINEGFYEKTRPNSLPSYVVDGIVEWDYFNYHGYSANLIPVLDTEIENLEKNYGIYLSIDYLWFIRIMNNLPMPHNECSHFRFSKDTWHQIKAFFPFQDLAKHRQDQIEAGKIPPAYLPIGIDIQGNLLLLNCDIKHPNQAGVTLWDQQVNQVKPLTDSFAEFINSCAHISEYFHPKSYHLKEGNIGELRNWLSQNWDVNEVIDKHGRTAIEITQPLEMVELLLQHGADPDKHGLHSWLITPERLSLLIRYGFDLKKKASIYSTLKDKILSNPEFESFRKLLE